MFQKHPAFPCLNWMNPRFSVWSHTFGSPCAVRSRVNATWALKSLPEEMKALLVSLWSTLNHISLFILSLSLSSGSETNWLMWSNLPPSKLLKLLIFFVLFYFSFFFSLHKPLFKAKSLNYWFFFFSKCFIIKQRTSYSESAVYFWSL